MAVRGEPCWGPDFEAQFINWPRRHVASPRRKYLGWTCWVRAIVCHTSLNACFGSRSLRPKYCKLSCLNFSRLLLVSFRSIAIWRVMTTLINLHVDCGRSQRVSLHDFWMQWALGFFDMHLTNSWVKAMFTSDPLFILFGMHRHWQIHWPIDLDENQSNSIFADHRDI